MLRPLLALLALAALSSCAPSAVGTIDLRTPLPTVSGQRLLVVVVPQSLGRPQAAPDTARAVEFVPLGEIGAASYRGIAADTLVAALRASGRWSDVRVGALPAGVEFVYGSFRTITPVRNQSEPRYARLTLAAPNATAGTFGPDVDAVLVVSDAATGFVKGTGTLPMTNPVTGVITGGSQQDDSIVTRAALVLWDDAAGAIAAYGVPAGGAPIRGRLFSSTESRSARALARRSREAFIEETARDMPALGLGD